MSTLTCLCDGVTPLHPSVLVKGLKAQDCPACQGTLLALDDYRQWLTVTLADRASQAAWTSAMQRAAAEPIAVFDAPSVRSCPGCARLMQRLRVQVDADFRVDRCAPCQLVWFDPGEWEALLAAGHGQRLVELLSDAGQRQAQEEAMRQRRDALLRERHGDESIEELLRMRAWMDGRPDREELLNLLRNGW